MTIGIMGAMPEEIESIKSLMTEVTSHQLGGRTYHQGKINQLDIVLVFSRWGKVASAITTTTLITHFGIDRLIFTGVAGATSSSLNIGDIVIADKLYQHDMDARPLMPRYEIPLTDTTFFHADNKLVEKAATAANKTLSQLKEKISSQLLTQFDIEHPKAVIGTIATGDQFISNNTQTNSIIAEQPETLAVEMEGAAVAQVCQEHTIPFTIIRTISDKADHSSAIDFPLFISTIAREYSKQLINELMQHLANH